MSDMTTQNPSSQGSSGSGHWYVGASDDIPERGRLVVNIGETSIGIFRIDGQLYAYKNVCAHMGGPICQGLMVPRVVEKLNEQQQVVANDFDESDMHIVCPWHGFEYSIKTGRHAGKADIALNAVGVEETAEGVYVAL